MAVRLDTAKLDRILATFPKQSEEVVKKGAFAVQGRAAAKAPVDTGNLKGSIKAKDHGKLLWWVEAWPDYGLYQELGFRHWITGQFIQNPYMVPAVEATQKEYTALWIMLFNRL